MAKESEKKSERLVTKCVQLIKARGKIKEAKNTLGEQLYRLDADRFDKRKFDEKEYRKIKDQISDFNSQMKSLDRHIDEIKTEGKVELAKEREAYILELNQVRQELKDERNKIIVEKVIPLEAELAVLRDSLNAGPSGMSHEQSLLLSKETKKLKSQNNFYETIAGRRKLISEQLAGINGPSAPDFDSMVAEAVSNE